ncbi:hypothetical protein COOONC_28679 [Cooperia oncophora]
MNNDHGIWATMTKSKRNMVKSDAEKDELMPLEGNGREACIAQFIDMCDDMVVDGQISVDEWCDCFSFADDLRHEPPCHKKKHSVDPHMTGVEIAQLLSSYPEE